MNIERITPTASVALADKARLLERQGRKIIKLQTGDPDFDTHPSIIEAAYKAMKDGHTHYSFADGLPALRNLIATNLNAEINDRLNENNILVTHGAAEGMYAIFASLLDHGDEVIILEPIWPTVDSLVTLNGGNPIKVSFLDEDNVLENLQNAFSKKTKAVCFNTPSNPTGTVLSQKLINDIIHWAAEKGIYVIADEVYRYLQYDGFSTSLHAIKEYDKYIFVDSFSKKYAMTGWRIGYIAARHAVIRPVAKASQLAITHVNTPGQYGAIEALSNPQVSEYCKNMKDEFDSRRKLITEFCIQHHIDHLTPAGAFYFFIKLKGKTDDIQFANDWLEHQNICVVPGSAYGKSGKGYFRVTFATDPSLVIKALEFLS